MVLQLHFGRRFSFARVVRVAGHSSLQIVRDLGQACAIVAKRETALPIRWPIWVAFAARVFL